MGSFDSLRYRDYRLLWIGATLSNVGTWMQAIALSWYVLVLTHSPFWVSFVTFANFIPTVISPIGGAFTDRLDRKRILLVTQAFMMVDAALLAVLAWLHHASLAAVIPLTFAQGLALAFNSPTWMAYVPSLVPPEALVNAIALNSAQFNLARVIGPAISGALIIAFGPGLVFGINAVSFVAVIVPLVMIRSERAAPPIMDRVRDMVVGGITYTWRHRRIRGMIGAVAVLSFFAAPVQTLLPFYATKIYGRGAGAYGWLAAAMGVGSVVGALIVGRLGSRVSPTLVSSSMIAAGAVLVPFSLVRSYPAGLLLMALYGATFLLTVASANGDIQLQVDERVRGRVLSIYLVAVAAVYPIGSLVAGAVAQVIGVPLTTLIGAGACAAWGFALLWRWSGGGATHRVLEA